MIRFWEFFFRLIRFSNWYCMAFSKLTAILKISFTAFLSLSNSWDVWVVICFGQLSLSRSQLGPFVHVFLISISLHQLLPISAEFSAVRTWFYWKKLCCMNFCPLLITACTHYYLVTRIALLHCLTVLALGKIFLAMWVAISSTCGIVSFFFASLLFDVSNPWLFPISWSTTAYTAAHTHFELALQKLER